MVKSKSEPDNYLGSYTLSFATRGFGGVNYVIRNPTLWGLPENIAVGQFLCIMRRFNASNERAFNVCLLNTNYCLYCKYKQRNIGVL